VRTEPKSQKALEYAKAVAMPMVTLLLGFVFNQSLNSRQDRESNTRLYTEMMGRREESDSALRKDMLKSILDTFMKPDEADKEKPDLKDKLNKEVLSLELLAYNFHEALDLGPLFKHVRRRIPDQEEGPYADMRQRLERVAREVNERQLTVLSESGTVEKGEAPLGGSDEVYLSFGDSHTVPNPRLKAGEGVQRICLAMDSFEDATSKHFRQFKLEIIDHDTASRDLRVRLYASETMSEQECKQSDLPEVRHREIDTTFRVGAFDFPMIDNTRLSQGERCAVSITRYEPYFIQLALAYFPSSRASLKDRPYYDELVHDLVRERSQASSSGVLGGITP